MAFVDFIGKSLSFGTLLLQAVLIIFLLHYIYKRIFRRNIKPFVYIEGLLNKKALLLAFILVTASTLGSLFYSEIAKFAPCELCWWQRGFMYPQVLFLGASLTSKTSRIKKILINTALLFSL